MKTIIFCKTLKNNNLAKRIIKKKEERLLKRKRAKEKEEKALERKRLYPLVKTFLLWIFFVFIANLPALKDQFAEFFINFTTKSVLLLSKLMFIDVAQLDTHLISVNNFRLNVIYECTAYNFYLFVIPLAIFSKWELKNKVINLIIFLAVIIVANVFRFIIMGQIGLHFPSLFDAIHDYLWNIIFGLLVFSLWYFLNKRSRLNMEALKI